MGRLSGKTAVITGAGSGIGRAASTLFAAEGARLVIADRLDTVHETAELVTSAGGKAVALVGDAGDEAFVEDLLGRAVSEYGSVDVVWANAGISGGWTSMMDQDAAFWTERTGAAGGGVTGRASSILRCGQLFAPSLRRATHSATTP